MFVIATAMLLAVVVAFEWGLVKFLREEIAFERHRKGFRTRRLRRVGLSVAVIASICLAVIGIILIHAIVVLW